MCALAGCFDFDTALKNCHAAGRCADAGSSSSGGGMANGGGTTNGGGAALGGGGVTAFGGGTGGAATPGAFCTDGGVCWELPVPTGVDWLAAYAARADDVWIAGEREALWHYDGTRLERVDAEPLVGHTPDPNTPFLSLWGSGHDDVWLVGTTAPLLHYDGGAWAPFSIGGGLPTDFHDCKSVDGLDRDRVWVSCDNSQYFGSAAAGFTQRGSIAGDCRLMLAEPTGVFCMSQTGIQHIANTGDVVGADTPEHADIHSKLRRSNGELWVGGAYGNLAYLARWSADAGWNSSTPPAACTDDVRGLAEEADGGVLMACGLYHLALVSNGMAEPLATEAFEPALNAVTVAGSLALAAGSGGEVAVRENGIWRHLVTGDARNFFAATAADGVLYAGGQYGLLRQRDLAGGWSYPATYEGPDLSSFIYGVAATDAGLWVAQGFSLKKQVSGASWDDEASSSNGPLTSLWSAGGELWAGALYGTILHRTPASATWVEERDGGGSVRSLWGTAPDFMFAVGAPAQALARDSSGVWHAEAVSPPADLFIVTGSSSGVWALATDGSIYGRGIDGGWARIPVLMPTCSSFRNTIAAAGSDLWVGANDQLCVLHRGAPMLESVLLPTNHKASSLVVDGNTLWVFGEYGTVLRKSLP